MARHWESSVVAKRSRTASSVLGPHRLSDDVSHRAIIAARVQFVEEPLGLVAAAAVKPSAEDGDDLDHVLRQFLLGRPTPGQAPPTEPEGLIYANIRRANFWRQRERGPLVLGLGLRSSPERVTPCQPNGSRRRAPQHQRFREERRAITS